MQPPFRNSLSLVLRRFIAAVSEMERTVLLPSLLRDVPSNEPWGSESCRDLYGDFLMLKAIRNTVESGAGTLDHAVSLEETTDADADAEDLFRFHLRGLYCVMGDLTIRIKSLTGKYKDLIGVSH